MSKYSICYIDDNATNQTLIRKSLDGNYHINSITHPQEALSSLLKINPDLILLDVNMPEINGYTLCKSIRDEQAFKETPIIFLTCRSELKDKLEGFASGGDAYITKPYQIDELKCIIETQTQHYERLKESKKNTENANNLVFSILKNNNEMGLITQYARNLSKALSPEALLKETISALNGFGLKSTLQIQIKSEDITQRSDSTPPSPIELELLELSKNNGRITHIKNKYIFSGNRCVFLIKNMPIEDTDLTGRLKDHLAIIVETCDAYIDLINYKHSEAEKNIDAAKTANSQISKDFNKIISIFSGLNKNSKDIFDNLISDIEESFIFLGLTEDQELQISKYIETAKIKIDQLLDDSQDLHETMQEASNTVKTLSEMVTKNG